MKCSRCGEESKSDKQICSVCGQDLTQQFCNKPEKPKISKSAIATFVLGILSPFPPFPMWTSASIVVGIVSFCEINRSKKRLRGKRLAIAGMIISLILGSIAFLGQLDAGPIENDYTVNDLHPTDSEFDESYKILKGLSCTDANTHKATGLTKSDINVIEKVEKVIGEHNRPEIVETLERNADSIKTAWQNGKKGRQIIKKLTNYPEINDLSKPDPAAEIKYLRGLRYLVQLYKVHIYLQTIEGKDENVLADLIEINQVYKN